MKPIDAAIKDLEMIGDCRTCGNKNSFCDSNPDSCSGYKWRGMPPASADDNQPLTLEQLREMDGEPVWVTPKKESKNWWVPSSVYWDRPKMAAGWWMLVNVECEKCFEIHLASAYFSTYGKNWLAYRRKPELC